MSPMPNASRALLLLLLALVSPLVAQQDLDGYLSSLTTKDSPGFAVLVRQNKNGKTLFEHGYGVGDLRTKTAINADTDFRLASCTKQFTAMSIMLLVHEGKLSYDQRLADIFPQFPSWAHAITVRNLLNHTAGLPDYESLMDHFEKEHGPRWTADHQITDAEVLDLLAHANAPKFPAGTKWSYSNSGYVVLGLITAKVSGMSFDQFLRLRIFAPLHMTHTLAYIRGKNEVPNRAYGHSKTDSTFQETDQSSTSATLGDGGVYSSLHDLALWDEALTQHTLLSAREMEPALAPFRLPNGTLPTWEGDPDDADPLKGKPVAYGFGWFLDPLQSHQRMWHYGDTTGFESAIEGFPTDHLTIILLANRTDLDRDAIIEHIAATYLP